MAILPIYESLKIKNLQTAKDHKMAISGVFRQSRKYSSFFPDSADHKAILTLTPTNVHLGLNMKVNHYRLKCAQL